MLATALSFGLSGIEGFVVTVEVDISKGMPSVEVVGLPDAAVKESRERVRAAVRNSGFYYPPSRITINLAPADTRKEGPSFDLPIALALLAADEQLNADALKGAVFIGEMGLDGSVKKTDGILPMLVASQKCGFAHKIIIPAENAPEAAYLQGMEIYSVSSLCEAVAFLNGTLKLNPVEARAPESKLTGQVYGDDLKYVKGQFLAKRALEIAAAGGHNIILTGPPGTGKTMLARCIPSILPDLTVSEAMETTQIYSVAGLLDNSEGLVSRRPFRAPHHTASTVSLIGGGAKARPGEVSLANNGVLFLDEMPEYSKKTLETLRQPLEDASITVTRIQRNITYPSNFMLVGSMNPCPCGNNGSTKECNCTPAMIMRYRGKISGPLLDRIDLHVEVDSVKAEDLMVVTEAEPSEAVKARVDAARKIQSARFANEKIYSNARMNSRLLRRFCVLDNECSEFIRKAIDALNLSARAYDRVLKVSRTIADLEGSAEICVKHLAEAVQYRPSEKRL